MESTLREYKSPWKQLPIFWPLRYRSQIWFSVQVQNVNNRRFTEFFDRYFHIKSIATKHELGLPFPQEPSYKIRYKSVHNLFSYHGQVTDRHTHTDTQTNAGENIFPRFRGDKNRYLYKSTHASCIFHATKLYIRGSEQWLTNKLSD